MASNVAITDLFYHHRLPDGRALLLFLLYIPFGILLLIVRFFFVLQLLLMLSVLPKTSLVRRLLLRVSCGILGIAVTQEGSEHFNKKQHKVIVSNHVSSLDNIAIEMIIPVIMPFSKCECPWLINKLLIGYNEFDVSKNKENMDITVKEYLSGSCVPLLVFPEDHITSGKRGLLKFDPWGFQFSTNVLPVLITVRRPPLAPIPPSVLMSGWWQDSLWTLFVPYTHYHIRMLPSIESRSEDFCDDVQKHIASDLGVAATVFTVQDVKELKKRLQARAVQTETPQQPNSIHSGAPGTNADPGPPPRDPNVSSPNTRLTRMVQQVKEVLPQVPAEAIARDLSRTHCVDGTITNILEGRVSYVPENNAKRTPAHSSQTSGLSVQTGSPEKIEVTFSRVPEERQKLLNKRKATMIENARRRFAAKLS